MKRLFHHPLGWGAVFLSLAVLWLLTPVTPAPGADDKVPDKLPKVEAFSSTK